MATQHAPTVDYALVRADCQIIADKIKALRKTLKDGHSPADLLDDNLWRAEGAIEAAIEEAKDCQLKAPNPID